MLHTKKPKLHHFVVADLHFGHDKIAQIRGYDSAASFEKDFVSGYLPVVQEHDVTWFLGDIFMGSEPSKLLVTLPGTKHLILGNHDNFTHEQYLAAGFASVRAMAFSASAGVVLTHFNYNYGRNLL
jgi:calcineurin-like phosphoesterase family protein